MRGVRLISTEIHKGKINLSFGNEGETTWAELMHGITDKEEALDVKEKLWRETGDNSNDCRLVGRMASQG